MGRNSINLLVYIFLVKTLFAYLCCVRTKKNVYNFRIILLSYKKTIRKYTIEMHSDLKVINCLLSNYSLYSFFATVNNLVAVCCFY